MDKLYDKAHCREYRLRKFPAIKKKTVLDLRVGLARRSCGAYPRPDFRRSIDGIKQTMRTNRPPSPKVPGATSSTDGPAPTSAHAPAPARPAGGSISARAMQSAPTPYLEGLNPAQREAIETVDGPVLVLAGAGTGKTRVLTTRIAHILATNRAYPSQILAVTFTNKAAREMKERIGQYVGGAIEGMPWLGTFHAICVRILRKHHELVGLKSGFTILDTDDQIRLMKQVIEVAGIDKDRWPARQLAGLIDGWKNQGLTPDKVPSGDSFTFANGKGAELYRAYQVRLKELNAADFGDLLLECLRLFQEHTDVLAEYQNRFRYILVDEYQDTNVAQYLWLRLLAQGSPNICCVGDDDQSIYGWRGAEVDNILRFDKDFPGAKVIRLEKNYRSTGHILAAASGIIAHNSGRLGKTLFTDDAAGEKVSVTGLWDDEEEARAISSDIEAWGKAGQNFDEIAILVRASAQMRAIEDRFVTLGIPYRVIGGPRFYERLEIRDAIAYLEITLNPTNDLRFERIVNTPKRGLGDTSVRHIRELSRGRNISMYQAACQIIETEELTARARNSLSRLLTDFERWRRQATEMRHTELAELILDESGYTAMWQKDKSPQAQSRLENLKELIRFMEEFESLAGFLEHVSLVMEAEQSNSGPRVTLMTLHGAKGLEFNTVFLPGWEEGLFPHQRALDENGLAGLEEERRLAYVGITRAKKLAKISFAQNRRMHGLYQAAMPSRFIDELPEETVFIAEARSPFGGSYANFDRPFGSRENVPGNRHGTPYGQSRFDTNDQPAATPSPFEANYDTPGWQRAQNAQNSKRTKRHSLREIDGKVVSSSTRNKSAYDVGARVHHLKFGYGSVVEADGDKLTVEFETAGRKRVVDSFLQPG